MPTLKQRLISLLRFSERFTKIDMLYAFKGGFWISFAQGSSSVLSLLLIIAFANLAPKELYGMYQYVLSLAGVLNIFSLTGMNNAVARAVAAGHEGVLASSVRYQLTWNLLMAAAFWALGGYYLYNGNTELATAMAILGIFVPGTLAFNTYGAYLEGKRNFAFASIATVVSSAIYVAGMISTLVLGGNLVALIATYALVTFIPTLFFYFLVSRRAKPSADAPAHILTYGRKLSLINILEPVSGQIDKILLAHFWGPADLAVYSLALAVPSRATSFIKSWIGVGFPKFARKTATELNSVFFRRIMQGMAVGGTIAIGYVALSPLLFTYLLPKYLESIVYSQILALGFLFAMPNRYVSLLLVSQQYSRLILTNSLVQTGLRIALFTALGVWGGIYGLVLAHVIVAGLGMIINIIIWKRGVANASA